MTRRYCSLADRGSDKGGDYYKKELRRRRRGSVVRTSTDYSSRVSSEETSKTGGLVVLDSNRRW